MASQGSLGWPDADARAEVDERSLKGYPEAPEPVFHSELPELQDVLAGAQVGSLVELVAEQRYLKLDRERRPVFRVTDIDGDGRELAVRVEASRHRYEVRMEIEPELQRPTARCIEAPRELFVDDVVAVGAARSIDTDIDWPVISRGASKIYHRPDPIAFAYDEVRPACVDDWGSRHEADFTVTPSTVLNGHYDACITCFRAPRTVGFDTFSCSGCGNSLARLALQGPEPGAIEGVVVECPSCGTLELIGLGD